MMTRNLRGLIVGFLVLSALPCRAEVRVVDDIGREVVLEKPAISIISLSPHTTENLFSAGAGDRVVGVVNRSDYPPEAEQITMVGTHVQFNIELIVSLKPDLIVAWQSGNPEKVLHQLEELGFPIYISQPTDFHGIARNIRNLAILAGTENNLDPDLETSIQNLEIIQANHQSKAHLRTFYQVWTEPLITLSGKHIVSRSLGLCGAANIFADMPMLAPRISIESIVEINPEVIVTDLVDGRLPDMSYWDTWNSIQAVRHKNYIFVDPDVMFRPTLRMLKGIPKFCDDLETIRIQDSQRQS
ncbi:MAG: cobalamin-binding protein [Gammaproteobacteria bacterium]|nr:cobalamin-binding protein [Gammaproteobacteria bacterium]